MACFQIYVVDAMGVYEVALGLFALQVSSWLAYYKELVTTPSVQAKL